MKKDKISFEVEYLTNDGKWICRYKNHGKTEYAPRANSLAEALEIVDSLVGHGDFTCHPSVDVKIIFNNPYCV